MWMVKYWTHKSQSICAQKGYEQSVNGVCDEFTLYAEGWMGTWMGHGNGISIFANIVAVLVLRWGFILCG